MSTVAGDRRRQRIALVVLLVVIALIAAAVAWTAVGLRGSTDAAAPALSGAPTMEPAPAVPQAVILMPINEPGDEFTPPMGEDVSITTIAAASPTGLTDVVGDAVGLYGGTMDLGSCDRDQLADFLETHPSKAQAWADVRGVPVGDIRGYLSRLTPLVLRTDTLVTNHGYADGAATTFTSVLEAGTAVLVDDMGVPAVRCYCGNPLTAAPDLGPGTTYEGTKWKGWKPENTVRIKPASRTIPGFAVVDPSTDSLFTRPAGSSGAQDAPSADPVPAGIPGVVVDPGPLSSTAPAAPASAEPVGQPAAEPTAGPIEQTPPQGQRPPGEPSVLFEVTSIAGVSSGPPKKTVFTLDEPAYLTSIFTYHYLNEGAPPGTVALEADDGTVYGPWPATGTEGQGGVPNANWIVTPDVTIPAGTYTVIDSDPATWSWALDTGQRGITIVQGIPAAAG